MTLVFRDTYATALSVKRKDNTSIQATRELVGSRQAQVNQRAYEVANNNINEFKQNAVSLQNQITEAQANGNTILANNLIQQLDQLNNTINQRQREVERLELKIIKDIIDQNEALNGRNSKINLSTIYAKFKATKQFDGSINPSNFVVTEIQNAGPGGIISQIENGTRDLALAANRFRSIVEGRATQQRNNLRQRDFYTPLEPSICGLQALDNEGNILIDPSYNIPFQYVQEVSLPSKSSNYESVSPMGRFEPHRNYSGSEPMNIKLELGYMAYASGKESDEGFIHEIHDRLMATQFPFYNKNLQNGTYGYGVPNKYLLNMYERYVNVPIIITDISPEKDINTDPYTWLSMGFMINITLQTSYRMSQVISADDVIKKGTRAYSHRLF